MRLRTILPIILLLLPLAIGVTLIAVTLQAQQRELNRPTPPVPAEAQPLVKQFVDSTMAISTAKYSTVKPYRAQRIAWQKLRALGDGGREALAPLLDDPNPELRLAAAEYLLRYKTKRARAVLQELKKKKLPARMPYAAESTLTQWKNGSWDADPDPAAKPTPLEKKELAELIKQIGLQRYRDALVKAAQYGIRLDTTIADEPDIPVGASKMGGLPDLPPEIAWPSYKNVPMGFIAQIRLADIAACDPENRLPHAGMLYFFYDGEQQSWGDKDEKDCAKIIYYPGESATLRRAQFPAKLPDISHFYPCLLTVARQLTLPDTDADEISALKLSERNTKRYWTLKELLAKKQGDIAAGDFANNQLLGHPYSIQNSIFYDCPKLQNSTDRWALALQVAPEGACDMMWGDSGCIYFLATTPRAEGGKVNLDNTWFTMQCY